MEKKSDGRVRARQHLQVETWIWGGGSWWTWDGMGMGLDAWICVSGRMITFSPQDTTLPNANVLARKASGVAFGKG